MKKCLIIKPAPKMVSPSYFRDLPTLVEICRDGTQIYQYPDDHYEATINGKNVIGTLKQIRDKMAK